MNLDELTGLLRRECPPDHVEYKPIVCDLDRSLGKRPLSGRDLFQILHLACTWEETSRDPRLTYESRCHHATQEAEEIAGAKLRAVEDTIGDDSLEAAQSIRHAMHLLTSPGLRTVDAAEALGFTKHAVEQFAVGSPTREPLEAALREVRCVLVWRCELRLGRGNQERRQRFLVEINDAATAAIDVAAAAESPALPYLQRAVTERRWQSEALHTHRAVVAKQFPDFFLSNLRSRQRTEVAVRGVAHSPCGRSQACDRRLLVQLKWVTLVRRLILPNELARLLRPFPTEACSLIAHFLTGSVGA